MRLDLGGGGGEKRVNCWTIDRQPPYFTSGPNRPPVQDTKL